MTCPNGLPEYHLDLSRAFNALLFPLPPETPLARVAGEIREMILSYLSDATSLREKKDTVNEYASLAYLHGWLDAGIFLGFFSGVSPCLFLPREDLILPEDISRLTEKTLRYEQMLRSALQSVEIGPESGSPLYHAAVIIQDRGKRACNLKKSSHSQSYSYAIALGQISYEYGWLDTALRAGLFRILANPELFTTETCRSR